jgi:hypothetical protein
LAWRRAFAVALALAGTAAGAQRIVTSSAPDKVAVTIYRDPSRSAERKMDLSWLNGYALISETRHVRLPAGESALRFEGVAGGILPQSAIVAGLPNGVVEKNLDAELLSPGNLLDRSIGRRVHLRRTWTKSGRTVEEDAIVRSGLDGAVVLQTAQGYEALRCTGLNETIVYDRVPEGLSAKPTLSVRTRSPAPVEADVTLSYLSWDFDWQADYVATLSPSEDRLDLFAWVTLANSDETSFVHADTQTIAGHPNRSDYERPYPEFTRPLQLRCWPSDTTAAAIDAIEAEDIGFLPDRNIRDSLRRLPGVAMAAPPPPPPPPGMQAQQENLGDLKLYRIPEPVTVAANSQKQVAMLHRAGVKVRLVYRSDVAGAGGWLPVSRVLRMRNRAADGLGLPLPGGTIMLFAGDAGRPLLLGSGALEDKAVGEEAEVTIGSASGIRTRMVVIGRTPRGVSGALIVTSDRDRPIFYEARFAGRAAGKGLIRRDGRLVWATTVPAHGRILYRFTL